MDEATQRVLTEDSEITSQNVHSVARTTPGPILCEKKNPLEPKGKSIQHDSWGICSITYALDP